MFMHKKEPIHPVEVKSPDPAFAQKLLEQFGGATGELTASLRPKQSRGANAARDSCRHGGNAASRRPGFFDSARTRAWTA